VEAAGIEPASRGISAEASTCVADGLSFALAVVRPQTTAEAIQELGLTADVPGVFGRDPELATDFWTSPEKVRSQRYLVRQRVRDCSRL